MWIIKMGTKNTPREIKKKCYNWNVDDVPFTLFVLSSLNPRVCPVKVGTVSAGWHRWQKPDSNLGVPGPRACESTSHLQDHGNLVWHFHFCILLGESARTI